MHGAAKRDRRLRHASQQRAAPNALACLLAHRIFVDFRIVCHGDAFFRVDLLDHLFWRLMAAARSASGDSGRRRRPTPTDLLLRNDQTRRCTRRREGGRRQRLVLVGAVVGGGGGGGGRDDNAGARIHGRRTAEA